MTYEQAQAEYNRAIARADYAQAVAYLDSALEATTDPWAIEKIRELRAQAVACVRKPFSLFFWRSA